MVKVTDSSDCFELSSFFVIELSPPSASFQGPTSPY